jgi:hypothetical protein
MALTKIVSGGQTGVDRGALDAAIAVGFPCGGWCPADRAAEDGSFQNRSTEAAGWRGLSGAHAANVIDTDGTAILFNEVLLGGTLLTLNLCKREGRPHVVIDVSKVSAVEAAAEIARFVEEHGVNVLNVAGPRASGWAHGYAFALGTVTKLIASCAWRGDRGA